MAALYRSETSSGLSWMAAAGDGVGGGFGRGGVAEIAANGGTLEALSGATLLTATGSGGFGEDGGTGGSAAGGTINVAATAGGAVRLLSANLLATAGAGDSITGRFGGAQGGSVELAARGANSVLAASDGMTVRTSALGRGPTGGAVLVEAAQGGLIDTGGLFEILANATGMMVPSGEAGPARGGAISLNLSAQGELTAQNLAFASIAAGSDAEQSIGGQGIGGAISVSADNASFTVSGDQTFRSIGTGGDSEDSNGGAGRTDGISFNIGNGAVWQALTGGNADRTARRRRFGRPRLLRQHDLGRHRYRRFAAAERLGRFQPHYPWHDQCYRDRHRRVRAVGFGRFGTRRGYHHRGAERRCHRFHHPRAGHFGGRGRDIRRRWGHWRAAPSGAP
jgi:hypothetical protein